MSHIDETDESNDPARPTLSLVVPTLNECQNVVPLTDEAEAAMAGNTIEILFADSASDDGTQEAVAAMAASGRPVRLLALPRSASLSAACVAAAPEARSPVIAVCDADLQHDLSLLPRLLAALEEGADFAVGSRYMAGGSSGSGLSPLRGLLSRGATVATRLSLGVRLTDPMSGFFALKRERFLDALPKLSGRGFKILLDLILADAKPPGIVELPYVMRPRAGGQSKLGLKALSAAARQLGAGALRRQRRRLAGSR